MLLYLHLPDVKTEIPIKTKEAIISPTTTGRTTKQPYDNQKGSESDNWKVGVSVGIVLFVLFTAIGTSLIPINCPLNYTWVLKNI